MPKTAEVYGMEDHDENCQECGGSGACDPCDGYGFYPDSYPGAGDGPGCERCAGSGECPDCHATGTTTSTITSDQQDEDEGTTDHRVGA